jgi:hypothetical protein
MRAMGIDLSVSTMADHVGACAATLMPIYDCSRGTLTRSSIKPTDAWRATPILVGDSAALCASVGIFGGLSPSGWPGAQGRRANEVRPGWFSPFVVCDM